jgi:hypothetical protein
VLLASPADDVQLRVRSLRPVDETLQRRALERGQVLAGEEAHEIGRGEDGLAVDFLQWIPCFEEGSRRTRQLVRRAGSGSRGAVRVACKCGLRYDHRRCDRALDSTRRWSDG